MASQTRRLSDLLYSAWERLSRSLGKAKLSPEQTKDLLKFFGTALGVIVGLLILLFALSFLGPRHAYGAEGVSNAEFDGIVFKTRYQSWAKIQTPILIQMDNEIRVLNIVLQDPASAKFSFLFKVSPGDYRAWREKIMNGRGNAMFTSSGSAYFTRGPGIIRIDQITLIIDTGPNKWLSDYKDLIETNFKNCKMAPDAKGDLDMVCPPFWISAKINRIERSTLSPGLPEDHFFPHLDYVDIYIEIVSIGKARPKN